MQMEICQETFETHYEVNEIIGSGQYAVVKKCTCLKTRVEYAAKFIRKRRAGGRRGASVEDIMKEIEILHQMDNTNVISLYEVYETSREFILVLELVSGGELFDYISTKDKLSEEEASAFVKQILLGVQHLHQKNIAHLDIKPENVLLLDRKRCEIKLIDFGISRILKDGEDVRAMLGTPEFVAPEVVNFEPLSLATDMWSIGVVTYILLTGASPFLGDDKNETYNNIVTNDYSFDDEYFSDISNYAKDFISRLLCYESRDRATVSDCLKHPWIEPMKIEQKLARRLSVISGRKLKKFQARKHWKQSLKIVSLCNKLSQSSHLHKSTESGLTNGYHNEDENFVMTALFCAIEEGNLPGIQDLLTEATNFNVNNSNKHGETAVHMAAGVGHVEIIEYLQTKGVDINQVDKHGDTALYWAARQGHLDAVLYLQHNGANINSQNKSGETPLHVATRYGFTALVEHLLSSGSDPNVEDSLGETCLHTATWHGYVPIVQLLCSYNADLSIQNKEGGETALHCAAVRGNSDCVKILIEFGAPLHLQDKNGNSALHLACKRHQVSISLLLLHAGCQMELCDNDSECALHVAAREGLLTVVQTMCALRCHIDILNEAGFTPLQLACRQGHTEVVRCLLLAGALPDLKSKDGSTAESMAETQGFRDIAFLLCRVVFDHQRVLIEQLIPNKQPLPCIKLKFLGSMGSGKSTLIHSLRCSFLGSLFHRRRSRTHVQHIESSPKSSIKMSRQFSLPSDMTIIPDVTNYTHGITVEHIDIPGLGQVSIWDFSGYEPYYQIYDYFLGDVNCIHIVTFSLAIPSSEQLEEVSFWIEFIRSRILPHEPIGHMGIMPNCPRVVLVATHADVAGCKRNAHGEYISVDASILHDKIARAFYSDVAIYNHIFVLDAEVAMGVEVKALKSHLNTMRTSILKAIPFSTGLLDTVIQLLPQLRKTHSSFPVFLWTEFVDIIRAKVNPLATDDHMKLLVQQLQLIGEIVYITNESAKDHIIINPHWLCNHILGGLLSHEKLTMSRITGCYTADDFQFIFHETDSRRLLPLLEAVELCTECESDGDVEYEFPAFIFLETTRCLWDSNNSLGTKPVYGGVRIFTSFTSSSNHLKYIFPRIQVQLRRMLSESEDGENELYQWRHGSKFLCSNLEGIVYLGRRYQYIEVVVRALDGMNTNAFYFLEDLAGLVEQTVVDICPGLCIERHLLSVSQLVDHSRHVEGFAPQKVYTMQLNKQSELRLHDGTSDHFVDVACLGSDDVLHGLALGVDLHVSHLNLHTRRHLSHLLDPPDQLGRDWCLLAVRLGLESVLPNLDSSINTCESKTDKILAEWGKKSENTIGLILRHLIDLGRLDAAEVIMKTGPLFKVFIYEETGDDCSERLVKTSSNTLSSLSH